MAAAAAAAGPAAAGAPSSLLLVVGGECGSPGLLAYVLEELERGIRSWGANGGVRSLDEELKVFVSRHSATFSSIVKGQRSLHHRGDALDTLVLLNPSDKSLSDELRNLLLDPAPHKLLVLAGPCLEETGELLLQTGGFSPHHFLQVLEDKEIQDILASTPPPADPATLTVTCPTFGDWVRLAPALPGLQGALRLRLLLNPPLPGPPPASEGLREFLDYLAESLEPPSPFELLEPPSSGGFLRLARPCCYVFPGGLGDAAFFAVNGFTVLVNGGSNPKATFWKLVRHLDRVDAVLVTHAGADSLPGLNSLLRRKLAERREGAAAGGAAGSWDDRLRRLISPALGVVFLNARAAASRLVGGVDEAELALSLLAQLGVTPLALSRGPLPAKPLVLFEKMGVGRLDLYVLHPPAAEPAPAAASVCALLVWHPAGPADKLVRVLFPGCTPPARVLDGLGRLQHLGFLREPVVTPQDLDGPPRAASRESLGARDGRPGPERPAAALRRAEKDARPARDAKKDPKAAGPRPQPQPQPREVRRAAAAAPGLKKSTPQAAPKPRRAAHAPQPLQNGPHSARGGGGGEPGEQQPGAGAERGPRGEAAGAALERGLPAAAHALARRDPRKPRRGQRAAVAEPAAARGGGARRLAHRDHAHADHALATRRGGLPALHRGGRVAVRVLRAGAAATQRAGRGGAEPPAARAPRAPLGLPARRGPVPRVALRVRAPQGRAAGALPGQLQRQQRALPGAGGRARGRGDAADVGQRVPAHAVRLGPPARRPRRRRLGRGHGGPGGGPSPRPSARAAQGAAAAAQPAQPLHGGPRDAAAPVGPAAGGRGPRTQSPGPARLPHRRAQGRTRDRRQEQGAGGRGPRRAAAQRPQRAQRQGGPGAPGQEVLSPQDGHPRPVRPRRQPARRLSRRARLPRLPGPGLPAQRERRAPGGRGVLPARARTLLRHQRPGPAQGGGDARRAGRAAGRQGAVGPRAAGDPDPHLRLGGHAPLVRGHARPAPGAGRHGAGQQQHGVHAGRGLPRLQGRVLAPPPPHSPAPGNKAPAHPHPGLDASSGGTPGLGGLLPGPCNSRGAAGAPWR